MPAKVPYSFELLQIESFVFFLIVSAMAISTWRSFAEKKSNRAANPLYRIVAFQALFFCLAVTFVIIMGTEHFIFAIELSFAVILSVTRPVNALCFFLSMLFLRPWEIAEPNALFLALPRLSALLVIITSAIDYFRGKLLLRKMEYIEWLLLGFASWAFLTTFTAPNFSELQSTFLDGFLRSIVIFFLITFVIRRPAELALLKQVCLFSLAGLALIGVYISWDRIWAAPESGIDRLSAIGSLENANDIAAVMLIGVPIAFRHLVQHRRMPISWIQDIGFLVISLFALYLAQSRGALLGLILGIAFWIVARSRKRWLVFSVAAITLALMLPAASMFFHRDSADLSESSTSRLSYWQAGLKMVARNPLTGVGFNRYPAEYQNNASGEIFEFGERTAHSTWILALAETGVPGFLLFVCFIFGVVKAALLNFRMEPDLAVALVSYLLAISFLSHTYLIYPYILFGMVMAGYRMRRVNA